MHRFVAYAKYRPAALIICLLCSFSAVAQQSDPFDGNAAAFHVPLTRYFKSPEAERDQWVILKDSVASFERDSLWTLNHLRAHLDQYETLLVSMERHRLYYHLRCYVNKKDSLSHQVYDQLNENIAPLQNMPVRLLSQAPFNDVTDEQLAKYNLLRYRYLIDRVKHDAVHRLSDHDEHLADGLTGETVDHLIARYDDVMDHIKAGTLSVAGKTYNPITDRSTILKSPDSLLRKAGSAAYYQAYAGHAELLAATLIDITRQRIALAKLRNFKSAAEQTYASSLQLTEQGVKQMLDEMTRHASVLQAYQQVQAEQVRRVTGIAAVHSWDTYLPMGFTWTQLPYARVRPLILDALLPLGNIYNRQFARLLDPANGELEIAGGKNRVTEFTSLGFPGVPESLYMKSYDGSLGNISRLAHEGGHAVHEQLMSDNRIVPSYKEGPSFLYEAYAMLNELLLLDALDKKEKTINGKAFYTKQFLDKLSREIFISAEEGTFEQELNDGVASGQINNREDIDQLYARIMNKYDSYFVSEPERKSEWVNKRLVFDDPIYNVNYLYAILVSCKLYQLSHDNPKDFELKYTSLLKNGFDAPANELLEKYMGFNLNNSTLLDGALNLMQEKTAKLKDLYTR